MRLGRTAAARAEFEASLKLNPDQPSALTNLAQIYFDSGARPERAPNSGESKDSRSGIVQAWGIPLLTAAMPGIGMLLFTGYLYGLTGVWFAWARSHEAWGRTYQGLGTLVSHQYSILANAGLSGYVGTPGYDVLNAIGALFALATVWPVTRRLGLAYGLFMVVNIVPALANGGLLSAGRFSSVLFPAFIWLAAAIPSNQRAGWIASFAALQAFGAALFYTWRPLF